MSTDLSLKIIQRSDGVLHPVLTRDGVPIVLPSLWIEELALTARFNTLKAYLQDVHQLYRWADDFGVNIYSEFASLKGLTPGALKNACVYMTTKRDGDRASRASCTRKAQALRSYFKFCFNYFIVRKSLPLLELRQSEQIRNALLKKLDRLFVMRSRRAELTGHSAALSDEQLAIVEKIVDPASDLNPFGEQAIRQRNYCIWLTLLATGARRAEIVLLELDHLDLGDKPTITIKRPTQIAMNRRRDGASLKTEQRIIPIQRSLADLLEMYLDNWRVQHIRARRPSPAVFLSAKDGRRLSSSTVNKILNRIATSLASEGNGLRIHPHGLRATAMNSLTRKARDDTGRVDPSFRDSLTYFAGWSPRSEMPLLYTREAVSEALGKLLRGEGLS